MKHFLKILFLIIVLLTGPLLMFTSKQLNLKTQWRLGKSDNIVDTFFPEASVRVYYGPTNNWREYFAVHCWLELKEKNDKSYQIFQVYAYKLLNNESSVDIRWGEGGGRGFWRDPVLLGEITGVEAEHAIPLIREAAENYPFAWKYRVWPGPNSNTFISHLMRSAGNLPFGLPPNAIGKDYPLDGALFVKTPSNTGWQFSLYGVIGIIISSVEGLRLQILGLEFGWNPLRGEFYWPGIGILSY